MPTSQAADRVAAALGIPCYETPTGWKFFGNLLDAGKVSLCGEESFGTGSNHVREKDGLWAVLLWLDIMARRGASRSRKSYATTGGASDATSTRTTTRRSRPRPAPAYGGAARAWVDCAATGSVASSSSMPTISATDPIDGSLASTRASASYSRAAAGLSSASGTGTKGATLRVYFEAYELDPARQAQESQTALQPLIEIADQLARIAHAPAAPSVIT